MLVIGTRSCVDVGALALASERRSEGDHGDRQAEGALNLDVDSEVGASCGVAMDGPLIAVRRRCSTVLAKRSAPE